MSDDLERLMSDPHGEAARDLAALGGVLVCFGCNDARPLPPSEALATYLRDGWPRCCGEEMRWLTAEQLGGASTSPISDRALEAAMKVMRESEET